MNKKHWAEERQAYGKILRLSLPIIIQNLFSAAVSSMDVIMLNSVGQSAISAVSLAVQYTNILFMSQISMYTYPLFPACVKEQLFVIRFPKPIP